MLTRKGVENLAVSVGWTVQIRFPGGRRAVYDLRPATGETLISVTGAHNAQAVLLGVLVQLRADQGPADDLGASGIPDSAEDARTIRDNRQAYCDQC